MKNIRWSILILWVVFACHNKMAPVKEVPQQPDLTPRIDYAKENYTMATVVNMTGLDGCGYLLKLEDGKKLEPDKPLEETFRVDGLPVWVKFQMTKGMASICMAGQIVRISHIEKRLW